jgi:hypothetical protein
MSARSAAEPGEVAETAALPVQHPQRRVRALHVWLEHRMPAVAVRAVEFVARVENVDHLASLTARADAAGHDVVLRASPVQ